MKKKAASQSVVKNQSVVKKNVAAIHIEAKLSLVERKLSNALLFNAYENLLDKRQHSIDIKTMSSLIGFDSKDDKILKDALEKLVSTTIKWNIFDEKGKEEWGISSLLAYGRIKSGICTYEYSSALAEKFYKPDIYARINLSVQRNIVSSYTLVLYETCLRFLGVGSTGWIELEQFKKIMGASENSLYENFKYLNSRIIKPAVSEINKTTNIFISVDYRRVNRSVTDLRFSIKVNPQLMLLEVGDDDEISSSEAYTSLLKRGISKMIARQWVIEYGEAYVLEKLDVTDHATITGKVKSVGGFLTKAMEGDYKSAEILKKHETQEKSRKVSKAREQEQLKERRTQKILEIERAHRSSCVQLIEAKVAEIGDAEAERALQAISQTVTGSIHKRELAKERWRSILNGHILREYFSNHYNVRFPMHDEIAKELDFPPYTELKEKNLEINRK